MSFNAFNEGTRLMHCLTLHQKLFDVKARKKATEMLYIFFGIHAANAVYLAGRLAKPMLAAG